MSVRMVWRGQQVEARVHAAAVQALSDAAEHILGEANRIAPKDEGTLIDTSETAVDPDAMQASIYYVQPYAARLHEHPEYNFQQGRQGKWLETTLRERADAVRTWMADRIRAALGG